MKRLMTLTFAVAMMLAVSNTIRAEVTMKSVEYKDGDTVLEGYVAYDAAKIKERGGKAPGVILVHQWKGLTEHEKTWANRLAEQGYVAFAADIYGKGNDAAQGNKAREFAGKYRGDIPLFRSRLKAALTQIRSMDNVDGDRIACIGFCFGGTGALELARSGADVRAVVSLHGGIKSETPEDAKNITASVLVLHGADDRGVPPADVVAFFEEMQKGNVKDWHLVAFGNTVHSFTHEELKGVDPKTSNSAYNEDAARRSWSYMLDFFKDVLDR
jgi:dienelactone hydrolase